MDKPKLLAFFYIKKEVLFCSIMVIYTGQQTSLLFYESWINQSSCLLFYNPKGARLPYNDDVSNTRLRNIFSNVNTRMLSTPSTIYIGSGLFIIVFLHVTSMRL